MTTTQPESTNARLREDYLDALVAGDGRTADQVIEIALDRGVAAGDIYLDIFQPSAYEIGNLWQQNRVSVAQEHLATAIIERQMGELHSMFRPTETRAHTIVIACVPDEWHRVGARMVADFFEAAGWNVHYLGAAVPVKSLVGLAREVNADMIGLSAEMVFNLPQVIELVRALDSNGLASIPVMVGGLPFVYQHELFKSLNVTGSATDAREAVAQADVLLNGTIEAPTPSARDAAIASLRSLRDSVIRGATLRVLINEGDQSQQAVISAGFDFTTRMIEAALATNSPDLLDRQIDWASVRQPYDGVLSAAVLRRFEIYAETMRDLLPMPQQQVIMPYLERMIERQSQVVLSLSA